MLLDDKHCGRTLLSLVLRTKMCSLIVSTLAVRLCGHTAARYGFIVMDGNGSLFGTLSGNTREVLHKFTVDLPKKHGRGGQSALRFARLRMEKRHNYVRKVRRTDGSTLVHLILECMCRRKAASQSTLCFAALCI